MVILQGTPPLVYLNTVSIPSLTVGLLMALYLTLALDNTPDTKTM
jgi:hypothetical protein